MQTLNASSFCLPLILSIIHSRTIADTTAPSVRPCINTRRLSQILFRAFDVFLWSLATNCILVPEYEQAWVGAVVLFDIFQTSTCCLRVQEVRQWYKACVEYGPDDIELPLQTLDTDRRDFDDHEIEDPVGGGAGCSSFCSHGEGVYFGWVKPWDTLCGISTGRPPEIEVNVELTCIPMPKNT